MNKPVRPGASMLRRYLYTRRLLYLLYFLVIAVFVSVMALFRLPMTAAGYAAVISLFCLSLFFVGDFIKFRDKALRLACIRKNLSLAAHDLPAPRSDPELQYQQLISGLYRLIEDNTDRLNSLHGEQLEYFTLWLHQIKTPIAALWLALEQDPGAKPVYRQELFTVERYVEMALQFIRMGSLSGDTVIRECELYGVVTACVKKYATPFIYKGLTLDFAPFRFPIHTDEKWLSFILEQFLSNAVKYTRQGGVTITLTGRTLVIRDTGIGIRREDLPRIFDKGYTGYNGRLDKRASGLGLYMAKHIAGELNIELHVESEVGKGTAACLTFPEIELSLT